MASKAKAAKMPTLINFLKEKCGVSVKEAELQKPTPQLMKRIFESMVSDYPGYARLDQLPAMEDASARLLSDPGLHEDAVQRMLFHGALFKFMRQAGFDSFSQRDIYDPDPARTLIILTYANNFLKYKSNREPLFLDQARAVLDPLFAEMKVLKDELSEMTDIVSDWNAKCADEQPELLDLDEEMKDLALEAKGVQVQRQGMQDENDSFQHKLNSLEEQVGEVKVAIVEGREEAVELKRQIVESPEKMQRTFEELQEKIIDSERQKEELKKGLSAMGQKKANIAKATRKVTKVKELLTVLEHELHEQKQARAKAKNVQDQVAAAARRLSGLQAQQDSEKEAVLSKMEQLQHCGQGAMARETVARQKLDVVIAERSSVLDGQEAHDFLMANKENQVTAMEKMDQVAAMEHHKRKARRERLWQDLLAAVERRRQIILEGLAEPPQILNQGATLCSNSLQASYRN